MSQGPASRRARMAFGILCSSLLFFYPFFSKPGTLDAQELPSVREATRGLERTDGFFPFYWDEGEGRILLEIPVERLDRDFLYLTSLATGIGSLDLGLDRGAIGDEAVVRFERVGPRLFLVRQNTGFRALETENERLVRSVRESFPTSVLAGFDIEARDDDRLLIDATGFFVRDAMDVAGALRRDEQGKFELDPERSAVYLPRTRAFPKNTEVEVTLTLASDEPGPEIRRHAPDAHSLTLREHHSLVELPEPGYRPREFDPRVGVFPVTFYDFSNPLTERYPHQWAVRWRLEKKDPEARLSEPKQPIVYYLDRGIPEPYRSAFREGALWWNEVLEAAGFRNAFQVKDLPDEVDPMDARFSVIQWVHRTEPGFSIGPSFIDPRTGEIIKAAIRMDSYRSLVDFNIWAGARPAPKVAADFRDYCDLPAAAAVRDWIARLDPDTDPVEFAMARRRQHAAHEVGHTLGLAHNFVASTYGRASVMDYPPPRFGLSDGRIDLSDAYRPGAGAYDSLAIRYAYTPFEPEEEAEGLESIVAEGIDRGLIFISDAHARPAGGSDPRATLWDDGSEALSAFRHGLAVRDVLISSFDERAIEPGEPMALLRERLAPVYLHHRYALEAATRVVGGMEITYAVRGDDLTPTRMIEPARQRAALEALLDGIEPERLRVPESVLDLLAPYPFGFAGPRRGFRSAAEPAFDPLGAARTLTDMVLDGLLQRERAARLVAFAARDPNALSLHEVLSRLIERTWEVGEPADPYDAALQRVVQRSVVDALIDLAADPDATADVRAMSEWHLERLSSRLEGTRPEDTADRAHAALAARDIRRFLDRRERGVERSEPLRPPPGSPIGSERRKSNKE